MMGLLDKIFRKKGYDPVARRKRLLENGRITDGSIKGTKKDADGRELIVFVYTLNGVDFESADELTPKQKLTPEKYIPGAMVAVRFDPRNQYDSIVE